MNVKAQKAGDWYSVLDDEVNLKDQAKITDGERFSVSVPKNY